MIGGCFRAVASWSTLMINEVAGRADRIAGVSSDQPNPWLAYPPAQPPERRRPRRWIVVIVVVWCVLLAAGVGWAIATGGPTAREQSTVAEALPVVDRATAELVRSISDDGQAVAAISGLTKSADCSVT